MIGLLLVYAWIAAHVFVCVAIGAVKVRQGQYDSLAEWWRS